MKTKNGDMVSIWYQSGTNLVQMWSKCGPNVVPMWYQCGPNVVRFWGTEIDGLQSQKAPNWAIGNANSLFSR